MPDPLFVDRPRARRTDPLTAHRAARGARSVADLVRAAYAERASLTADECVDHLRAHGYIGPESTVEACISRLEQAGELMSMNETRPSRHGVAQLVRERGNQR
jgi:hypothetical protein